MSIDTQARKPYRPPQITPLGGRTSGKHAVADIRPAGAGAGAGAGADGRAGNCLGGRVTPALRTLVERFGSPLFIVDEVELRARYRAFVASFTDPEFDVQVAYSYKTNYLPAVCALLRQEGAFAEVVSGMEYQLARALGNPGREIVFNAPHKSGDELERAINDGALINLDGFDELTRAAAIANRLGVEARVGLRINFRSGEQAWTKFGFNFESGEASRALERVAAHPMLRLEALHNHSGTYHLDPTIYGRSLDVLIAVAREARRLGLAPRIVDLGGGYPSDNVLKPGFALPGQGQGTGRGGNGLAAFAEVVLGKLRKAQGAFGPRPLLVLEPGRSIVDSAVRLAASVVATKQIAGRGPAVVLDAGVNLVPTAYWYDHGIEADPSDPPERTDRTRTGTGTGTGATGAASSAGRSDVGGRVRREAATGVTATTVFGPLCMQIDVLRERALLPPLAIGDLVVLDNVGAYCLTQSMQFIQTRPAVVLDGPGGPFLIRRRETWRDVFALDGVPAHLRTLAADSGSALTDGGLANPVAAAAPAGFEDFGSGGAGRVGGDGVFGESLDRPAGGGRLGHDGAGERLRRPDRWAHRLAGTPDLAPVGE